MLYKHMYICVYEYIYIYTCIYIYSILASFQQNIYRNQQKNRQHDTERLEMMKDAEMGKKTRGKKYIYIYPAGD